jgi:hypothetical protein
MEDARVGSSWASAGAEEKRLEEACGQRMDYTPPRQVVSIYTTCGKLYIRCKSWTTCGTTFFTPTPSDLALFLLLSSVYDRFFIATPSDAML